MSEKKVRLACIASGSGTDFNSIATAWKNGWIPEVKEIVLISTKEGAGCIEKADKLGIRHKVVKPLQKKMVEYELTKAFNELGGVDLIFLVGCVFWVPYLVIPTYNIHPANPHDHGGQDMYGLDVHRHVLLAIRDQIKRNFASINDRFFTTPVVHEVSDQYDQGKELLRASVEIPAAIIKGFISGKFKLGEAAKKLQKYVLPYEWQMLPCAVRMAAKKILDERS